MAYVQPKCWWCANPVYRHPVVSKWWCLTCKEYRLTDEEVKTAEDEAADEDTDPGFEFQMIATPPSEYSVWMDYLTELLCRVYGVPRELLDNGPNKS